VKVRIARNIEALKTHGAGLALWQLYKAGPRKAGATVLPCLDSRDATRSWQAAMLFAMWGDPAAEPRLLRAIRHRETGVEHDPSTFDPRRGSKRILPRWWAAVTLLRRCGTLKAIPTLQRLASSADLPFRIRTAMVITITRISERCHPAAAPYRRVRRLVDALAQIPTPVSVDNGGAFGWQLSDAAARAYSVLDKAEGQP
jgi:hypothetical protein